MQTTDRMRAALDWCDRRGIAADAVYADGAITLKLAPDRESFVALCRAAGLLDVHLRPAYMLARSEVDGFTVTAFAGRWADVVEDRDGFAAELTADLNRVHLSDEPESCATGHDWEELLHGDQAYDEVCTRCGLRASKREQVSL